MLRSVGSKVAWVGRTASMVLGLALVLALVFGVASMAFGANGSNFILGSLNNAATAITKLTGNVSGGPALQVQNANTAAGSKALQLGVAAGKAPLTVNATAGKATNLNSDKLDGLNSSEIGDNGWSRGVGSSATNSDSPKAARADCPSGKVVVGTAFSIAGGQTGTIPNAQTDVVVTTQAFSEFQGVSGVTMLAHEEAPTAASWSVHATVFCIKAGTS